MKTIEEIKIELLNNDLNKFIQSIADYDISGYDQYGNNILHYYILNNEAITIPAKEIICEFLSRGLDVNSKQTKKDCCSALYLAVQVRSKELVALLLEMNAEVDLQDINGNTPLWQAVMNYRGDSYFIDLLLKYGAKPNLKNKHGVSPKKLANTIANYDTKKLFDKQNNDTHAPQSLNGD